MTYLVEAVKWGTNSISNVPFFIDNRNRPTSLFNPVSTSSDRADIQLQGYHKTYSHQQVFTQQQQHQQQGTDGVISPIKSVWLSTARVWCFIISSVVLQGCVYGEGKVVQPVSDGGFEPASYFTNPTAAHSTGKIEVRTTLVTWLKSVWHTLTFSKLCATERLTGEIVWRCAQLFPCLTNIAPHFSLWWQCFHTSFVCGCLEQLEQPLMSVMVEHHFVQNHSFLAFKGPFLLPWFGFSLFVDFLLYSEVISSCVHPWQIFPTHLSHISLVSSALFPDTPCLFKASLLKKPYLLWLVSRHRPEQALITVISTSALSLFFETTEGGDCIVAVSQLYRSHDSLFKGTISPMIKHFDIFYSIYCIKQIEMLSNKKITISRCKNTNKKKQTTSIHMKIKELLWNNILLIRLVSSQGLTCCRTCRARRGAVTPCLPAQTKASSSRQEVSTAASTRSSPSTWTHDGHTETKKKLTKNKTESVTAFYLRVRRVAKDNHSNILHIQG